MAIVVGEVQNAPRVTSLVMFDKRTQLWTPCEVSGSLPLAKYQDYLQDKAVDV
jgi:hypothetical protein